MVSPQLESVRSDITVLLDLISLQAPYSAVELTTLAERCESLHYALGDLGVNTERIQAHGKLFSTQAKLKSPSVTAVLSAEPVAEAVHG
jgi:hypothetical protein